MSAPVLSSRDFAGRAPAVPALVGPREADRGSNRLSALAPALTVSAIVFFSLLFWVLATLGPLLIYWTASRG